MKKVIFAVLVVLMAALAVTCDSAIVSTGLSSGPGQALPPPPPGMVTLGISVENPASRLRALTGQTAQTDQANFYEVVFLMSDGTTTYRQSYNKTSGVHGSGETPTPGATSFNITVGIDEYDNATAGKGKAIILAGYDDGTDKTLLGIGTMTAISYYPNNGANGTTEITKDTTGATFTLYPLTAAVTNAASSSFLITGFTGHSGDEEEYIDDIEIDNSTYPIFGPLPEDDEVTALYTFACGVTDDDTALVIITGATLYLTEAEDEAEDALTATATSIADAITPASGALTGAIDDGFEITFTTEDLEDVGYCKLYIEVDVIAINATAGAWQSVAKVDWVIRGGLDNTVDTTGGGNGGAVLLVVAGEADGNTVSFPVTPGWDS